MEIVVLIILGLAFGSFIMALTWRLHEKKDFVKGRSQCEKCGHQLAFEDLIPVFSWLFLKGKCRYCNKKIGWDNILTELIMASIFVGSYLFWPFELNTWQAVLSFSLWLVYLVILGALFIYDVKWMLLPNVLVFPLILLSFIDAALRISLVQGFGIGEYVLQVVLGALSLGGFYFLLYFMSKGRWVGFGDVKLGLFMGVVLGWRLALLVLFLSNFIGFIYVVPGMARGKLNKSSRLPFGPFLIVAFILTGLFGQQILDWYMSFIMLTS